MSDVKVCEVKVNLIIGGSKEYPNALDVHYRLNSYAGANISFPPSDTRAESAPKKLTSADVTKRMGQYQDLVFSARSSPDSELSISVEGADVNVSIPGFMQTPTYSFSPYMVSIGASILDEYAIIDLARWGIYGAKVNDTEMKLDKTAKDFGWDIPKYLEYLMQTLLDEGPKSDDFESDEIASDDKSTRQKQHELNKKVFPKIQEILGNSSGFGWADAFGSVSEEGGAAGKLQDNLKSCLLQHLAASKGSFLTTLLDIAAEFQCFFVGAPGGGKTKYELKNRDSVMSDENARSINIPITSLNATTGSGNGIFPTRYVSVMTSEEAADSEMDITSMSSYAAYPEKNMVEGGTAVPISPPSWLAGVHLAVDLPEDGSPAEDKGVGKKTPDELAEDVKKQAKKRHEDDTSILKQWASVYYAWTALASSQVVVEMPMTTTVDIGYRYKVSNVKGEFLFSGHASDVRYILQTGSGSSNKATVVVTFSHVEFGSFKLPK